jgi:hypothetical protein
LQAKERLLNARICLSSLLFGQDTEARDALGRIKHRLARDAEFDQSLAQDILAVSARPTLLAQLVLARFLRIPSLIKHLIPGHCRAASGYCEPGDPLLRMRPAWRKPGEGRLAYRLAVKRTFDRTFAIIAEELTSDADVILDPSIEDGDWPSSFEKEGSWHHMGTTRMDDSPKLGVVDRKSRVHGMSNFYVAGSSVFPTAGGDFPTITIVALALRLADHIAGEMRQPVALRGPLKETDR